MSVLLTEAVLAIGLSLGGRVDLPHIVAVIGEHAAKGRHDRNPAAVRS